jgi:hypothetical protein
MAKKLKHEPGTAMVSMKDLEKYWAEDAAAAARAAPAGDGVPRISSNNQTFQVGEQMLDDPLNLIVVADSLWNIYYDRDYDPNEKIPPACFAMAPAVEGAAETMHAHPTSPNIQGGPNDHDCPGCPQNRYGSAERGKGKACANTRQLAVVMADDPGFKDGSDLKWAILSISPTGLSHWGKYVQGLWKVINRAPWGVVTQFSFNKKDPVEQRRKAVIPLGYKPITDPAIGFKVLALHKQIVESGALLRPIPVGDYVAPGGKKSKATPAEKKGKKKPAGKKK